MGQVEEFWNDSEAYNIQFITTTNRRINKLLIVNEAYSQKEMEQLVLYKFNKVKKVTLVESIGECLALKVPDKKE